MVHPKTIGDHTTLAVMFGLCQAGYTLWIPFGENTRCDLVIDDGTRLFRVQCKTGRLRAGAVRFEACSSYAHHANAAIAQRGYRDEIDFFGVFCPETNGVHLVPIGDAPTRTQVSLRVAPTRNGQSRRIRFGALDEIANLGGASSEPRASSGARQSCA